jgi:type I restriction enzyme S subunit
MPDRSSEFEATIAHSNGLTLDRLRLYYKDFAGIVLPYPVLPEQRGIAATLSFLEELRTNHAA